MTDVHSLRDADGLYPDDVADVFVTASPEKIELLARIGKAVVEHDRYDRAMRWLNDVYSEFSANREGTCGLLYGEPGVGKSTILRRFVSGRSGPFETRKGSVRPVVRIVTPANPTPGDIFDSLLLGLGVPELIMGNVRDRKAAVVAQIERQNVRMLILDEFTHVVEDRSEKFTKKAARAFKEFLSERICQVVFAGTEELIRLRQLYPQLRRRSGGDFHLTPFDWDDDDDRAMWFGMVEVIDDIMLVKARHRFGDFDMARNLHQASNGNIDNLMKLLLRATSIAYDEGSDRIEQDVLAEAFERMRRGSDDDNPFGKPRGRPRKPRITEDAGMFAEMSGLSKRKEKDRESFARS